MYEYSTVKDVACIGARKAHAPLTLSGGHWGGGVNWVPSNAFTLNIYSTNENTQTSMEQIFF